MDLNKMQQFVTKVQNGEAPKWLSRKLLVTVAIILGFFWMFSGNTALILWQVTILAGVWLLCTTATDIVTLYTKQALKEKLIDSMTKDGALTPEEAEIVERA